MANSSGGSQFGAGAEAEIQSWTYSRRDEEIVRDHDGWTPGVDADDALACASAGLGPDGWRRSDAGLRDRVCEHLLRDRILDVRGIEVRVDQGRITLCGQVRHASDVKLAEILTREAAGGAEVRNQLRGPHG